LSWRDRPYAYKDDTGGMGAGRGAMAGGMRMALPSPGKAVKWLLIANLAVFVIQAVAGDLTRVRLGWISRHFGATLNGWWQVWRYVTSQFLHASVWHLFFNMLGLYMLGTPVEQKFGTKRFLALYLLCGASGGLMYVTVSALVQVNPYTPIVGASGGVYGIIVVAAVYFPHINIIFLFFPVPIRIAALIIFAIMGLTVLSTLGSAVHVGQVAFADGAFWSQVAHFGGAVTAGVWILLRRRSVGRVGGGITRRIKQGHWKRKMAQRADKQRTIDQILEKIHQRGIASLSRQEKRLLQQATEEGRNEDRRINQL